MSSLFVMAIMALTACAGELATRRLDSPVTVESTPTTAPLTFNLTKAPVPTAEIPATESGTPAPPSPRATQTAMPEHTATATVIPRNPLNKAVSAWVVFDGAAKGVRTAV